MAVINHSTKKISKKFIENWLKALNIELLKSSPSAVKLKIQKKELSVVFLDSLEAKKLNKQYRKKNYATDILSFGGEAYLEQNILGELVICPQVIEKQAKEHQHSFQAELGYMLIHGVLHLLGYDHEKSKTAAKKMFTLQDQIFDRMTKKFDI